MSILLKQSLLLTHGTIYGQALSLAPVDLANKSVNIDQWNNPSYDRKVGLFERRTMADTNTGTTSDNAPIDFIHWTTAGNHALSPMAPWRNCTKLLRHI